MIRNSIFFLLFFCFSTIHFGFSQSINTNKITLNCFQRDYISWEFSFDECTDPIIDSFQIHALLPDENSYTIIHQQTDPTITDFKDDIIRSAEHLFIKYFFRCSNNNLTISSDTISLNLLRQAVELDTIQVLPDGNVYLSWRKIPIDGMSYIVKSIIDESSQEISGTLHKNSFVDTRGLANKDAVNYSISAYNSCNYNLPEPDEFYRTSILSGQLTQCSGKMEFHFSSFSKWRADTKSRYLMVEQNGTLIDSMSLQDNSDSFVYDRLTNNEHYSFYVLERSSDPQVSQIAISNSVEIAVQFYEPIKWITIQDIAIRSENSAAIAWETNLHDPQFDFVLYKNDVPIPLEKSEISVLEESKRYQSDIPDFNLDNTEYRIGLQDSCGNEILSLPKTLLITDGNLSGGLDFNIRWNDISDSEWRVDHYNIYYQTNGSYSLLESVNKDVHSLQHSFDNSNPLDSICYYIEANGALYPSEAESSSDSVYSSNMKIRSIITCLYGETIISIPNAFHANGENTFKPIIAPTSNISSYSMMIFDRYGNLVFKTDNLEEGWNGYDQQKNSFTDTYVVLVEMENNDGKKWKESGSLLLFH